MDSLYDTMRTSDSDVSSLAVLRNRPDLANLRASDPVEMDMHRGRTSQGRYPSYRPDEDEGDDGVLSETSPSKGASRTAGSAAEYSMDDFEAPSQDVFEDDAEDMVGVGAPSEAVRRSGGTGTKAGPNSVAVPVPGNASSGATMVAVQLSAEEEEQRRSLEAIRNRWLNPNPVVDIVPVQATAPPTERLAPRPLLERLGTFEILSNPTGKGGNGEEEDGNEDHYSDDQDTDQTAEVDARPSEEVESRSSASGSGARGVEAFAEAPPVERRQLLQSAGDGGRRTILPTIPETEVTPDLTLFCLDLGLTYNINLLLSALLRFCAL